MKEGAPLLSHFSSHGASNEQPACLYIVAVGESEEILLEMISLAVGTMESEG